MDKIDDLERRIKELESQKKGALSMFGRSYSQIGSSDSDFLIKTKGQVKILWGTKFIDLIKDGKINVDAKFIYKENLVGSKDGIYIILNEDSEEIWIVVGGTQFNIKGKVGDTYVSFLAPLETTFDQKHTALKNIGFIYDTIEDVIGITSGIVYVESEKKLYTIENGNISEFNLSFPNPFTEQFIIAKSSLKKGALVIRGVGINNSIAFDNMCIYEDGIQSIIDSKGSILFKVKNKNILELSEQTSSFVNRVVSDSFESRGYDDKNGFKLYIENGSSILEVDKIIERTKEKTLNLLYPQYWLGCNGIISNIVLSDGNISNNLEITLLQEFPVTLGDILITYLIDTDDGIELIPIKFQVKDILEDGTISINSDNLVYALDLNNLKGKFIYKISSPDESFVPIRLKSNSIDIVKYSDDQEVIKTRIGDLSEIEGLEGNGIYTDNLKIGGSTESNLPKYTESLKSVLNTVDIKTSDLYDSVLATIGTLKLIYLELINRIEQLESKIT